jgi:ribosomal protein L29
MATTKKAAAPKTAKKATVVKDVTALRDDLATKQQDLLEAKRSHAGGELVNPRVLRATRKEIARIHTQIRASEIKESK